MLGSIACFASQPIQVTIQVVDAKASERHVTSYVPGTNSHSNTNCDSNATAYGTGDTVNANGTTNCTTTTTPGTPGHTVEREIPQAHVFAVMPDGSHVTLWCQVALRHCATLSPGSYQAEVKGNVAWIHVKKLDGSDSKIKYHSVGGW
jgi:hypothetical protein